MLVNVCKFHEKLHKKRNPFLVSETEMTGTHAATSFLAPPYTPATPPELLTCYDMMIFRKHSYGCDNYQYMQVSVTAHSKNIITFLFFISETTTLGILWVKTKNSAQIA